MKKRKTWRKLSNLNVDIDIGIFKGLMKVLGIVLPAITIICHEVDEVLLILDLIHQNSSQTSARGIGGELEFGS
jgi:hypothetical protein